MPYHDDSPVTFRPPTEDEKIAILNRIDQEWGCNRIIGYSQWTGNEYCMMPEWEPFSLRCYDHTPGVMHSWDM